MNKIEQAISEIEDFIEDCKPYPLSRSNVIVPREELSEKLVELRMAVPDEIKQCQKIIMNQNAILQDAKAKAENTIAEANRMKEQMVDEHAIMQQAYATRDKLIADATAQAQQIIEDATAQANSIKLGSMRYTDDMLQSLQTIITHSMNDSQAKLEALQGSLRSSLEIVTSNRQQLAQSIPAQAGGLDIPSGT